MKDSHGFLTRRGFIGLLGASAGAALLEGTSQQAKAFSLSSLFGPELRPRRVTPYITPNNEFYLVAVDPAFRPQLTPRSVEDKWHLQVTGLSGETQRHDWHTLMNQANQTVLKTFECIGNRIGGNLIGNARWNVIPLKHFLMPLPGIQSARSVMFRGLDNFYSSISIDRCLDDYAFIAVKMNGEPLPAAHGFPARVILPDLYGMKQPRWLTRVELQGTAETTSYWEKRGWGGEIPVRTMSRLDPPGPVTDNHLATLTGIAYAGHRGIRAVEISLDGGTRWIPCQLQHGNRPDAWSLWSYEWRQPSVGRHQLMVRATDGDGKVQTANRQGAFPDGATGYDHLDVNVTRSQHSST